MGRGPAQFTGAADTKAESSEVILQCVETTLGLGLQSICLLLTSSAALLPPELMLCPLHTWLQVPGGLGLSFPSSPALLCHIPADTSLGFPGCFPALKQDSTPGSHNKKMADVGTLGTEKNSVPWPLMGQASHWMDMELWSCSLLWDKINEHESK